MTVIVDTFEITNNPKTKEQLDKLNLDYQVQSLTKGGDYIIEGNLVNIVIERKEISDLFSSNHSGRLAKQMEKLKNEYPDYRKILLIEGNIGTVVQRKKFHKGDVIDFSNKPADAYAQYSAEFAGIVSSILTTSDITVIQVASKWQTITLLRSLDEWANGKRRSERHSEIKKSVDRTLEREAEDVILSLRGMGWKKTRELFNKFSSIEEVFNDIEKNNGEKLKEVLGYNLAKHIIDVFSARVNVGDSE